MIKRFGCVFRALFHFVRGVSQLLLGVWRVTKLPEPRVSIFGGSRAGTTSEYVQQAHEFAELLAQHDISVLTGGGPGIMEAANCGIMHVRTKELRTMGIGLSGLRHEKGINPCSQTNIVMDHLWARKWLLIDYSQAYVVFPGGFGTMDELMELLTLIQIERLPRAPIVLIHTAYWHSLLAWIQLAQKEGMISAEHAQLITATDDQDYALSVIQRHCCTQKRV